jgi:hypothetical protein
MPRRTGRLPKGFAKHSAPVVASRSGSTKAGCGAAQAWDASIRRQVRSCRLFVPVISASTQAREEGYFRREWNLAVARNLDMAHHTPFLLPVAIDATGDADAPVPDKFREVQWTRLPSGETPASFVERVRALISSGVAAVASTAHGPPPASAPADSKRRAPDRLRIIPVASAALLPIVAAAILMPQWCCLQLMRGFASD